MSPGIAMARELGVGFVRYWNDFEDIHDAAVVHALGRNDPVLAGLEAMSMYGPDQACPNVDPPLTRNHLM